ncbi:MAG: ABC transporter substrate-binding protein [Betaproteobacteria bacterium]|nr:ABC transporter substrate-binding protein [Betaproteobacteria bacterium]
MKISWMVSLAVAASMNSSGAWSQQADKIRLGFMTTLSGPIATLGKEQEMGLDLALKQLGGRIGGIAVEVFKEDSRMQPDTAVQAATKLVERNQIDFLTGTMLSNQLLAIVKPVTDSGAMILSGIGGPSELAGAGCNKNLFVMSWENNTPSESAGKLMTDTGRKRGFFIAQNYVTGKEHVAGAKQYFKGQVAGEAYPDRTTMDFAAEISQVRAANADAVYVFMPGAQGIAFAKQYAAAGLAKDIPMYSGSWLADEHSYAALGDLALGTNLAANWFVGLDNPQNKIFVEAFRKEYGRNPVFYAAFVYDSIMLLDSAVRAVNGNIRNKDALRAALRKADFRSTRGKFRFNTNQFPVQDFYVAKVVKDGNSYVHQVTATAFKDHADRFATACKM